MACDEWFELISAAADGQLDDDEAVRLDAHLDECPACARTLRALERNRRMVRLHQPAPGAPLVEGVLAARTVEREQAGRARARLVRRGGIAAAAVAAAMIGVVSLAHAPADLSPPAPDLGRHEVLIDAQSHAFEHADVEVPAGTTVEWRNAGATRHNLVRRLGGATITEELLPGRTETARFSEAGVYPYYCTIHPEMTGTVTVDA